MPTLLIYNTQLTKKNTSMSKFKIIFSRTLVSGKAWLLAFLLFLVSESISVGFLATLDFFTLASAWIRSDALFLAC